MTGSRKPNDRAGCARLDGRGAVRVTGPDAVKFLQGLVTNDVERLRFNSDTVHFEADAVHAGLLSPQGKILFDMFCVRVGDGFLLEVARDQASALAKRLAMYKLRADVLIADASADYVVLALWGEHAISSGPTIGTVAFRDPRHRDLGFRILAEARFATDIASATNGARRTADAYHGHRVSTGVPEGGKDYAFGDAVPHEANFDLFNGASFTKGCYVGQEVVSRMQNKSVIRKRIVRVDGDADLTSGSDVLMHDVVIGRVGSVAGRQALALLRLDRVDEAFQSGRALTAGSVPISVEAAALAHYRAAAAVATSAPAQ